MLSTLLATTLGWDNQWLRKHVSRFFSFTLNGLKIKSIFSNISIANLTFFYLLFTSVQFSRSVMSDSLWSHESQHARPPCPSQTPGAYSNSCPLSQWCHPAISSSVIPFSSCPQSLPASGPFPMSQLFIRAPRIKTGICGNFLRTFFHFNPI